MQKQITVSAQTVTVHGVDWETLDSVDQCSVCMTEVSTVPFCLGTHTVCQACYDRGASLLTQCPLCRGPMEKDLTTMEKRRKTVISNLNKTPFFCQAPGCRWHGGYSELEDHKKSCQGGLVTCSHEGCEQRLPRTQIEAHQQEQCPKRPHKEGNMVAPFEVIAEAKRLRSELSQVAQGEPLTVEQKGLFYDRMITVYESLARAALPKQPTFDQSKDTVPAPEDRPCHYQCGFKGPPGELNLHHARCLGRSVRCRHCRQIVLKKNLDTHEGNCLLRTERCAFCSNEFTLIDIDSHLGVCPLKTVVCDACGDMHTLGELEQHKLSTCSERPVHCPSCLTPTIFSRLQQGCWCRQPITLTDPNNSPITLVPQPDANCPVYQEENGDSSTIYLVTKFNRFQQVSTQGSWNAFRDDSRFLFCNEASSIRCRPLKPKFGQGPQCPCISFKWFEVDQRGREHLTTIHSHQLCIPAHIDFMTNRSHRTFPFKNLLTYYNEAAAIGRLIYVHYYSNEGEAWLNLSQPDLGEYWQSHTDEDYGVIKMKKIE